MEAEKLDPGDSDFKPKGTNQERRKRSLDTLNLEQLDGDLKDELHRPEEKKLRTLKELVFKMGDDLHAFIVQKGWSYERLSKFLETKNVLISATTLKSYLSEFKKGKKGISKKKVKPAPTQQSDHAKEDDLQTAKVSSPPKAEVNRVAASTQEARTKKDASAEASTSASVLPNNNAFEEP